MEIPNFHEEKNGNRFQKHQNIIVPNTQDDPNQIESDQNKSKRDIFFLHRQGATKTNQRNSSLFTIKFWIYLA